MFKQFYFLTFIKIILMYDPKGGVYFCEENLTECSRVYDLQIIKGEFNCTIRHVLDKINESAYRPVYINKYDLKTIMNHLSCIGVKLKIKNSILLLSSSANLNSQSIYCLILLLHTTLYIYMF